MISIYQLKPRFQALLRPIARSCATAGVTANKVTVAAMLVSLALGAVLAFYGERREVFLLLPLWMFLRMAFNAIDGMLARRCWFFLVVSRETACFIPCTAFTDACAVADALLDSTCSSVLEALTSLAAAAGAACS